MGIQQALFAQSGSAAASTWSVVDFHRYRADGTTFSLSNLQQNDLIYVAVGSDTNTPGTVTGFTTQVQDFSTAADIGRYVGTKLHTSTSSTLSFSISGQAPNYGIAFALRSPNQTGLYDIDEKQSASSSTAGTPTHNNTTMLLAKDSIVILEAFVDDDNASPMGAPTDSTLITEDVLAFRGSLGLAYKIIPSVANYSWGSWTTTGTDSWITSIRRIRES
jgi:hypothetical protein